MNKDSNAEFFNVYSLTFTLIRESKLIWDNVTQKSVSNLITSQIIPFIFCSVVLILYLEHFNASNNGM